MIITKLWLLTLTRINRKKKNDWRYETTRGSQWAGSGGGGGGAEVITYQVGWLQ